MSSATTPPGPGCCRKADIRRDEGDEAVNGVAFPSPASPSSWLKKRQRISQDEGDKGDFERKGFLASGLRRPDSGLPLVATDVELGSTEVDEEAEGLSGRLDVVEALGGIEVRMFLAGLQLDDHGPFHDQVRDEITHQDSVVADFDALLLYDREASLAQLMGQSILVDLFEKAGTKRVRHLVRTANDPFRECIIHAHSRLQKAFSQDEGETQEGKACFSKSPLSPASWLKKKEKLAGMKGMEGIEKRIFRPATSQTSWLIFSPVIHGES
jgi:hypothetical protein